MKKYLPELSDQYLENLKLNTERWKAFSDLESGENGKKYVINLRLPSVENGGMKL